MPINIINGLRRPRSLAALPMVSLLALVSVGASQAWAVDVPSTATPGQVGKSTTGTTKQQERLKLNVPPPVESQRIPDQLRSQLEAKKFALKNVVLEGATVYKADDLDFAYAEKIGQTISLLDARAIANKITAYYRNNGYILSQAVVPAQDVTNGTLKVRIVEGFISRVSFEGDVSSDLEQKRLNSYADSIKNLHPARMAELERYMLLMNDLPGSTITGLIRPSSSDFGAADLVLTVRHKMFEGSYTFDNRGSQYLGPWQHTFVADANSIFGNYDHTRARVITAMPFKELFMGELSHDEVLDNEGTKLTLLGSYTRTEPGDDLRFLRIVGESTFFQAKVSHPFLRSRQQSLVGRVALDTRETNINVFEDTALTRDRLRTARVGGTYSFLDKLQGSDSIDVQISQGMSILDATDHGIDRSNPIGDSSFTKANFDISRLQPLPDGFSVLASATGQYSFSPLLTDEKFSMGGADFGRAFDPGETLGDSGLAGKIEARYDGLVEEPYFDSYQLFTFVDIGEAWTRGTGVGSDNASMSMSTFGFGVRAKFTENLFSSLEADVPLIKPNNDSTDYRENPRIFFSITAKF